jgi:hypothetical protein
MSYNRRQGGRPRLLESLSSTVALAPLSINSMINKTNEYKRRLKGLTEKIVIIDTELKCEPVIIDEVNCDCITGINFKILSSNNNIYNLELFKKINKIMYNCNCPDFQIRKVICKHVYWLGYRKFQTTNPLEWSVNIYENLIIEHWRLDNYKGYNDICPICLENIDYNNEFTVSCKYKCYNSIHSDCWKRYYDISSKKNCVFCRSDSMLYIK